MDRKGLLHWYCIEEKAYCIGTALEKRLTALVLRLLLRNVVVFLLCVALVFEKVALFPLSPAGRFYLVKTVSC